MPPRRRFALQSPSGLVGREGRGEPACLPTHRRRSGDDGRGGRTSGKRQRWESERASEREREVGKREPRVGSSDVRRGEGRGKRARASASAAGARRERDTDVSAGDVGNDDVFADSLRRRKWEERTGGRTRADGRGIRGTMKCGNLYPSRRSKGDKVHGHFKISHTLLDFQESGLVKAIASHYPAWIYYVIYLQSLHH